MVGSLTLPHIFLINASVFSLEGALTGHQPRSATAIARDSQYPQILKDRVQLGDNQTQSERQISPVDRRTQPQAIRKIPRGNSIRRRKFNYADTED